MKMMNRLFELVGRSWSREPNDVPVLIVRRGTGKHTRMTVDGAMLHFHTIGYQDTLPVKETVYLDEYSLGELAEAIGKLGYEAEYTGAAVRLKARGSITLLPARNSELADGAELRTFTSRLWELFYPIARLLEEAEGDMDAAIRQMYADSTRGRWLDYWASFFGVRRSVGESDPSVLKRMLTSINGLKTNNIAVSEVLRGALLEDIEVADVEPGLFQLTMKPAHISQKQLTDELINSVKGAGYDYIYNYVEMVEENYPSYLQDRIGKDFGEMGEIATELEYMERRYGWRDRTGDSGIAGFLLNRSHLNRDSLGLEYWMRDDLDADFESDWSEDFEAARRDIRNDEIERHIDWLLEEPYTKAEITLTGFEAYGDLIHESYRFPTGFTLNRDNLNRDKLMVPKMREAGSMTLTDSAGAVVQTSGW